MMRRALGAVLPFLCFAVLAQAQGPVAARALPRGTVLVATDLAGHPTTGPDAVGPGWITRRAVRAGEPLRPPAVVPRPLVTRGQRVTVQLVTGALRLAIEGTALADAGPGDRVAVRLGPKRIVQGTATGPALIILPDSTRLP